VRTGRAIRAALNLWNSAMTNAEERRERLRHLIRLWSYREGDFLLASGRRSSFYVDVRRTALNAEGGWLIGEQLLDAIVAQGWKPAGVGGLTLGADPLATATAIAAWHRGIACSAFIVRKEAKEHGTGKQIELAGDIPEGATVVVLDDSVTTGGSTLKAVEAVRRAGFHVCGAACVVDRQEGAHDLLAAAGVELVSLFTLDQLRWAPAAT
jgi:orotate phosphoribosyltransferase